MATIQGVYVALFGRPADPAGLAYFNGITNNGANLSSIASLAGTKEYTDRFAGQTNTQIVNSIYQSLFNRDAEPAGLNFFVDALNKGTLNINNIAIAILDGAQGTDKTTVTNKITAADNFTKATDTPTEIANYTGNTAAQAGRDFLKPVTSDVATVPTAAATDAAVAGVATSVNKGNTFTTAAVTTEVVVGAVAAAGVTPTTSSDKDDTITVAATSNATAVGKINGGFGTDTVILKATGGDAAVAAVGTNVSITDGATAVAPEYTSVEKLVLTAVGGALSAGFDGGNALINISLSKAASVTEVVNEGSVGGTVVAGDNQGTSTVNVSDVALATKIGFKGTVSGATTIAFKDASGASDTVSVALDGATVTGTTTLNSVETFNVSNTGTSSIALTADTAKAANLSGSGTLTFSTTSTVLETVVNTSTGTVNANLGANNALKSYTGSASTDSVTLDNTHTNDITINTGAGADSVTVLAATGAVSEKAISITLGDGSDIVTFGATGAKVANVVAVDTAANLVKSLITVTDFNKTQDAIKFSFGAATTQDKLLAGELGQVATAGGTSLLAAVNKAAEFTDAGKFSIFTVGSDTYIFGDTSNAGGTTAVLNAGDTLIKVTGIVTADLTDSNFQIFA